MRIFQSFSVLIGINSLGLKFQVFFCYTVEARNTASYIITNDVITYLCLFFFLGWFTMDDFALGDFTVADYALLEDYPYVDDCVFAPKLTSNDYVRVTQLYCDGVVSRFVDFLFLALCLLKGF